ncbi:MAG: glycerate kinase [Syntrophales bacterium]
MISREMIFEIFNDALKSVLPCNLIREAVKLEQDHLIIQDKKYNLNDYRGVHIFGSGKASVEMAKAVKNIIDPWIKDGFVVSNYGDDTLDKIGVFESSHPVPSDKSIKAAEMLMERLMGLSDDDFFIYLLSGGSSSLVEKPVQPVALHDFQSLTKQLLLSGAPIEEMNVVRKHLSTVKGGRLGELTRAKGVVLVISDVIGDDLETIGSAPLFYDRTSYQDTRNILLKYNLYHHVPASVKAVIEKGLDGEVEETPKEPNLNIEHFIVGSNLKLLMKGKEKSETLGVKAHIMSSRLRGEAREIAKVIVAVGEEIIKTENPFEYPVCLLFGGETTVTIKGNGKGGRNQEMCLAALKEIRNNKRMLFLSAGTDGIDGNSDAAGAVVDYMSHRKAGKFNLAFDDYLNNNDSYHFFKKTGDLIFTGPTGTNVMDITILLIGYIDG